MKKTLGKLVVVSGPSGAGKGTLLKEILKNNSFIYSVSATTRKPREGEIDGKNYFFITKKEFENKIKASGFVEHAKYNGNYYGTPLDFVNENLNKGKNVILEIDVQGAMQIKKIFPGAVFIFITPESRAELEKRLRGRNTENEQTICNRLKIASHELSSALLYDYIILNKHGRIKEAADDFFAAVRASCLTPFNRYDIIKSYFDD